MSPVQPDPPDAAGSAASAADAPVPDAARGESWFATPGRHGNYAAAVYGSVLASTVVISAGDLRAPFTLAVLLLGSGFVFWIAHVYAATVAGTHGGWHVGSIWKGMRHEWPVAFAAVPPALAAVVSGLLPHMSVTDGVWAALGVCLIEQQVWGLVAIRHAELKGPAATRTVLLNVVMGFFIIALKLGVGQH